MSDRVPVVGVATANCWCRLQPWHRAARRCLLVLLVAVLALFAATPVLASTSLPDGRQWELVTPVSKGDGIVGAPGYSEGVGGLDQASERGGAITYFSTAPFPGISAEGNRAFEDEQYISERTASGWQTKSLEAPSRELGTYEPDDFSQFKMFSGELSVGLLQPAGPTSLVAQSEVPEGERTLYLRDTASGAFSALINAGNVSPAGSPFGSEYLTRPQVVGGTPDLAHIVFESPLALTNELAAPESNNLYEWSAGRLQLVSVRPDGVAESEPSEGEGAQPIQLGYQGNDVRGAVSADGHRVVFTGGSFAAGGAVVFLRDVTSHETVPLSLPTPQAPPSGNGVAPIFQDASAEGTKVFFTDSQPLTEDASTKSERSLYVAEIGPAAPLTVKLQYLAPEVPGTVSGISENGEYVYFRSALKLTADGAPGDMYVDHEVGGKWVLRAIGEGNHSDEGGSEGYASNELVSARVSPDGQYFTFMSTTSLTGYNNIDTKSGRPDEEVYLYDASTNGLRCISCDPSGAPPSGIVDPGPESNTPRLSVDQQGDWQEEGIAATLPLWPSVAVPKAYYQPRYLSNTGRVFFNAETALVPADVNSTADVYEYEPENAEGGSCNAGTASSMQVYVSQPEVETEPVGGHAGTANACIGLMSSGHGTEESAFLDASEPGGSLGLSAGEDVYLLTTAPLVSNDTNDAIDVYDAHRCSSAAPCVVPPVVDASVPCASLDECHGGPPATNAPVTPASVTLSGIGDLGPAAPAPAKPLTKAQKLTKALKACRRLKARKKRSVCERNARVKYAARRARRSTRRSGR